jgi:hypothetical protein
MRAPRDAAIDRAICFGSTTGMTRSRRRTVERRRGAIRDGRLDAVETCACSSTMSAPLADGPRQDSASRRAVPPAHLGQPEVEHGTGGFADVWPKLRTDETMTGLAAHSSVS